MLLLDMAAFLRSNLLQNGVLVVRDCPLTKYEFADLARAMGDIYRHILDNYRDNDVPDIMLLSNRTQDGIKIGIADAGREWHSDSSFDVAPPDFTMLLAEVVPSCGGETEFKDLIEAYNSLDECAKSRVCGAIGVFSYISSYEKKRKNNPERPPLTDRQLDQLADVTHPITHLVGSDCVPALYMSGSHLIRVLDADGVDRLDLLVLLQRHLESTTISYRHHWKDRDLLMWDNRSVVHRSTPYPSCEERHIFRTMVRLESTDAAFSRD